MTDEFIHVLPEKKTNTTIEEMDYSVIISNEWKNINADDYPQCLHNTTTVIWKIMMDNKMIIFKRNIKQK